MTLKPSLVLIASIVAAPLALGQGPTTGQVEGTVLDAGAGPLPGARVEARSPRLPGVRETTTDAEGRFRFLSLPPGTYELTAVLAGFSPVRQPGIPLGPGATARVGLTLAPSASASVTVAEARPLVDVTTPSAVLDLGLDVLKNLPTGPNYIQAVLVAPGTNTDNADVGNRGFAANVYGATSLENLYLVDGANATGVLRGYQGKILSYEFVEQMQVRTSAPEAEYGGAVGGLVNVVTRSGGNELHGDVFGNFGFKSLTAASVATPATDATTFDKPEELRDFGLALGGPVVKDRLWYFAGYNRQQRDRDQLFIADPSLPNAGSNFPETWTADLFSGKLSASLGTGTSLTLSAFGDPESESGEIRNFTATDPNVRRGTRTYGATDLAFAASHLLGERGLLELRLSRHAERFLTRGEVDTPRVSDSTIVPGRVVASGGFGPVGRTQNYESDRNSGRLQASLFTAAGEIKGGLEVEREVTTSTAYRSGGYGSAHLNCPTKGSARCPVGVTTYWGHTFFTTDRTDPAAGYLPAGNTTEAPTNRFGAFLQDRLQLGPSLTVSAGLRYDREDVRDWSNTTVFTLDNEWQPRIGIAWDPSGRGSTRVSGSFSRSYLRLPQDLNVRAFGNDLVGTTYNFSPTSLAQDPLAPLKQTAFGGSFSEPVAPELKGTYQDEVTLGFETALDRTLTVALRYTHRRLKNVVEDRCDMDTGYPEANGNNCVLFNPGSDSPFSTGVGIHTCTGLDWVDYSDNPAQSECVSPVATGNNGFPAAERRYDGVELLVRKQVPGKYFVQASYVWSALRGNYDGAASLTNSGQSDPGVNADFDYPLLYVNADGRLFLDRPHSFRLDAFYTFPIGLTAGFQGYIRSGAPISRFGVLGYNGYGVYLSPRGSEGRQPTEYEISLSLQQLFEIRGVRLTLLGGVRNLLNRQSAVNSDQYQFTAPPTDPYPDNPDYGKAAGRTAPRAFTLGARIEF